MLDLLLGCFKHSDPVQGSGNGAKDEAAKGACMSTLDVPKSTAFGDSLYHSRDGSRDESEEFNSEELVYLSSAPPHLANGAPMPDNELQRLDYLMGLKCMNQEDQFYDDLTKMLAHVFKVDMAVVALAYKNRMWFKAAHGVDFDTYNRRLCFCTWTLLPLFPEALVVPDTTQDVRFRHLPFVVGPSKVRFYVGVPLQCRNGLRLGALALCGKQPRFDFDAEMVSTLAQFASVVTSQLERDALADVQVMKDIAPKANVGAEFWVDASSRTHDWSNEGLMLCDLSSSGWPVLFMNAAWSRITGQRMEAGRQASFRSYFQMESTDGIPPSVYMEEVSRAVHKGHNFEMRVSAPAPTPEEAADEEGEGGPSSNHVLRRVVMVQWWSASGPVGLCNEIPAVGVPPGLPVAFRLNAPRYYFATIHEAIRDAENTWEHKLNTSSSNSNHTSCDGPASTAAGGPSGSSSSWGSGSSGGGSMTGGSAGQGSRSQGSSVGWSSSSLLELQPPVKDPWGDIELGVLLGRGSFGRVYRGTWDGAPVAVKVLQVKEGLLEALLTDGITHPNVVAVYKVMTVPLTRFAALPDGFDKEAWIVQEFCSKGTLSQAVERGWLLKEGSASESCLLKVLTTGGDIARAMHCLHNSNIIHGDLTGRNVLLSSSDLDGRGFMAKVADFGQGRLLGRAVATESVPSKFIGTITHMPPEVLCKGQVSKAADVYAFGMILLEMLTGSRPFMGQDKGQVIFQVMSGRIPQLPEAFHPSVRDLVHSCLAANPAERPTFEVLVGVLRELQEQVLRGLME